MAAILIVEDRPIDRRFLGTLLKSAGHTVIEASDGVEALAVASRTPPDLVISDILMPTIDGYELVRQMREMLQLRRTPVIFYTATYHEREARTLAHQCGVADILTKPSEPKVLLAKVDAVLASARADVAVPPTPLDFTRQHTQVVSSALAAKIQDFEASEQRMAAFVDIAHQIAAERDPGDLLSRVCDAAREVTLAQHAIIKLLSDDASAFGQMVTSGMDLAMEARMDPPSIDAAAIKPAIEKRQAVRMRNPGGRPEDIGLPANHPPTFSSLVVPIASPSRVYGCLGLRNKLGAESFSDRDEQVALALATHACVAYENARLYEDLRRRTAALEQEVAERSRAEAALRESEERTRFAHAAARMGVWDWDLASDRVTWSGSSASAFGLAPEDAPTTIGGFFELVHPEDRDRLNGQIRGALAAGQDLAAEFRTIWPDGSIHWMDTRARIVYDEGRKPLRILGINIDVSDRKSLEDQLRQAQKMEAVGQLAGGVAHDFNNLLTAIRGYAGLVLDTFNASDQRRDDVDEIIKAADRAAGLTRQLLAFSRKQVLEPRLLDVNGLVIDTGKMLRRLIGEDIELVTTLTSETVPVRADPGQLEQILMNLAVNARDAMPQGGHLTIETANVLLDDSYVIQNPVVQPGSYVMLAVSDSGVGMDEATKRRIFEPFFTTKERGRGTGLGLATVYGIVKQSGGYIWVYSEPGQGTTFKVYLPRATDTDAVESQASSVSAVPPTGSETILLVEDENAVRFLSRVLLERAGYRVLDASDPQAAEELFERDGDAVDLLVTDVIMPGSSGPALFERLSARRPGLKVLYMSGYTDDAFAHRTKLGSDVMFLQKPFTADGLVSKVREALDR